MTSKYCTSDSTRQALQLGRMMKHQSNRFSIVMSLNMPKAVASKFLDMIQNLVLKHNMENVLEMALPPKTNYACAKGFSETQITHVFYNECTHQNCDCARDNDVLLFSGRDHRRGRNKNLTWRQVETLLFLVEMQRNIVDTSQLFSERVQEKCTAEGRKFSRGFMFRQGESWNQKILQSAIRKERKAEQKMLHAISSVSSRSRVLWAKVRRCVRMYHYAHKLWEYKFSPRAVQNDMQSGAMLLQEIF